MSMVEFGQDKNDVERYKRYYRFFVEAIASERPLENIINEMEEREEYANRNEHHKYALGFMEELEGKKYFLLHEREEFAHILERIEAIKNSPFESLTLELALGATLEEYAEHIYEQGEHVTSKSFDNPFIAMDFSVEHERKMREEIAGYLTGNISHHVRLSVSSDMLMSQKVMMAYKRESQTSEVKAIMSCITNLQPGPFVDKLKAKYLNKIKEEAK